jgi:hypothetical protein
MKIKEFILENKSEFINWIIDKDYVDEDDIKDIKFEDGCYEEGVGRDLIKIVETDEICCVVDYGVDFSFDRKFVSNVYNNDAEEDELIINGKKVYVLIYNIFRYYERYEYRNQKMPMLQLR